MRLAQDQNKWRTCDEEETNTQQWVEKAVMIAQKVLDTNRRFQVRR